MSRRISSTAALVLSAALLAAAIPATAGAKAASGSGPSGSGMQGSTAQPTVSIDDCTVRRSRNDHGFTYFYCAVVVDPSPAGSGSVRYAVDLPVFVPSSGGTWSRRTGTIELSAGSILNLKFASRRSVAQVRAKLRVTLSGAQGLQIADASAGAVQPAG